MLNLTGEVYGKLTVIEPTVISKGTRIRRGYKCICECGNIKEISTERLRRKGRPVKSCGSCPRYKIESLFTRALYHYKANAKRRGLKFLLSDDEVKVLFSGNCYYCGDINTNCISVKYRTDKFYYNGIDRLDSSKDYSLDNCVSCCKDCNYRKGNSSYGEFISWIKKLYEYNSL